VVRPPPPAPRVGNCVPDGGAGSASDKRLCGNRLCVPGKCAAHVKNHILLLNNGSRSSTVATPRTSALEAQSPLHEDLIVP